MHVRVVLKPTKAVRAVAPDLFGQPAYYDTPTHRAAIVEQLKACGLLPAAWALGDALAHIDTQEIEIDSLAGDLGELEYIKEKTIELAAELDRYKNFFADVVRAFEEAPGTGFWPAAEPDDDGLMQAITKQLQSGPA